MTNSTLKPPTWFWVVSVIVLLWNLMGVTSYLTQAFTSIEQLEAMSQAERALFEGQPAWVTGAFAIAVFGGTIAAIALLLRKKWSKPVFIVSLVAGIAQFIHWLFMTNAVEVHGTQAYIMPGLVVIIGLYEIFFANQGIQKGWLY